MNFHILTLFPEFFDSPLRVALLGRAREAGIINFSFHNPRDFSHSRHRHIDDSPYGGGPGMILQIGPLADAISSIGKTGPILFLTPDGYPLDENLSRSLALHDDLTLICGRYEGVDARLEELFPIYPVSVGNAILNGGECAALAVIEAVSRFLPGFLGKKESTCEESLAGSLLEYPQYTRPPSYKGHDCPQILLEGNHGEIKKWRRRLALEKTLRQRPELLDNASLCEKDIEYLSALPRLRRGRMLSFCLCHYPVKLEKGRIGSSSLTNLDVHDIARISHAYGMGPFFVLTPFRDQLELLRKILSHWLERETASGNRDRANALSLVRGVENFEELAKQAENFYGTEPRYIVSSATWPGRGDPEAVTCHDVAIMCQTQPVIILLGTARGLDMKSLPFVYERLRPVRFLSQNHLSVRGAAAILADRILGDFH